MTKIIGAIIYVIGAVVPAYMIMEGAFDNMGGEFAIFAGIWFFLVFGIGTALMKAGENNSDKK